MTVRRNRRQRWSLSDKTITDSRLVEMGCREEA